MDISKSEIPSSDQSNRVNQKSCSSTCELESGNLRRKFGELQINTIMSPIRNGKTKKREKSSAVMGKSRITDYFNQTSDKNLMTSSSSITQKDNKWVQTESKCSCDYYDVEDMIMMSSQYNNENYFQQESTKLQPKVDELLRHKIKLEEELDVKKNKIDEIKESIGNLMEIIELGQEMAQIVDGYDKNINSIIINDSGCADDDISTSMTSQSTSFITHNVDDVTDDDVSTSMTSQSTSFITHNVDDVTDDDVTMMDGIREMLEEDQKQLEKQSSSCNDDVITNIVSTSSSNPRHQNEKNSDKHTSGTTASGTETNETSGTTTTIFTQTSLCCQCDWTNEEIEEQMTTRHENNECDFMFNLSKLQTQEKMTSQMIDYLQNELNDGDEEIRKLKEDEERLQQRSEDVTKLTKLVETHILGDSGIGDDIEE